MQIGRLIVLSAEALLLSCGTHFSVYINCNLTTLQHNFLFCTVIGSYCEASQFLLMRHINYERVIC